MSESLAAQWVEQLLHVCWESTNISLQNEKSKTEKPETLRFQAFYWSEWRDLNSRPLDPQLRFDALHQIFYSSKSRFHKNAESLDTSMFFVLLLYHTSAADTIFFVQFQKKKAHKSAQIFEVCALFVRQKLASKSEQHCSLKCASFLRFFAVSIFCQCQHRHCWLLPRALRYHPFFRRSDV